MWFLRQPSEEAVRLFLARQSGAAFSYPGVGSSQEQAPPPGFDLDHERWPLGGGQAVFAAACAALRRWEQFPAPWTRIYPAHLPLQTGNTVVMQARVYGLWWLNACRIVYVIDEPRRFGFAYGTLPEHVERGEERFLVEHLPDDQVWYDIRAFSRPQHWSVRLGYPLARRLQARFRRESVAALRRCATASATREVP